MSTCSRDKLALFCEQMFEAGMHRKEAERHSHK